VRLGGVLLWAGILLGTRVPFLPHGYGVDADAWRVVETAQRLIETGRYEPSRLPGYPVHEFVTALLVRGGPWLVNGASAVLSVIAAALFARYLSRLGFRRALLGASALALTPTVFVESTSAMDYAWSLAFLMGALVSVQAGRVVVAGVLLGVAIGCRLTSAVMAVPLGLLAMDGRWREREGWIAVARLAGVAAAIGALLFLPVIVHEGGLGFITFFDRQVPWSRTLFQGTIGTWGPGGCLALALAGAVAVAETLRGARPSGPRMPAHVVGAWAAVVVIYSAGFVRVPFESAYMIPTIPFVLLLAFRVLPDRARDVACVGLILSPLVLGLHHSGKLAQATPTRASIEFTVAGERVTLDALQGPIVNNLLQRRNRAVLVSDVLEFMRASEERSVLVAGWLAPELRVASDLPSDRDVFAWLSAEDWAQLRSEQRTVFYLPGGLHRAPGPDDRRVDVAALGALPLRIAARSD
jgi:hypothetical protein